MKLEENILKFRKQHGLSQEQLGTLVNVDEETISKWESGETIPNLEQLKLLSNAFSVSIDQLLDNHAVYILEEKTSNTEKVIGTKPLKCIGIIIIFLFIFGFTALLIYIKMHPNKKYTTSQVLSCTFASDKYIINISEDNSFGCDNCNDEMIDILGILTNTNSIEISTQKIKEYFMENGGSCE